jgi:butyrate kinase
MISGGGGLLAYTGTNDMITITREAEEGEEPVRTILNAMLYTIAKQIGAMHIALEGKTDAIILTGGIAHSRYCTDILTTRVGFLAPVVVMPGENEIESLAYNAQEVLAGRIVAKEYI